MGKSHEAPSSAARYLCSRLGVTPESMGWVEGGEVLKAFLNKTRNVESPSTQPEQESHFVWEDVPMGYERQEAPHQETATKKRNKPNNIILTEDWVANRFVKECGHVLRYCHSTGLWFKWDDNIWRKQETRLAFHWARLMVRNVTEYEEPKVRAVVGKTSFARGVESFAQCDPDVAVTIDNWDRDEWLLGTPSGTVDLRTGKLRAAKQEDGITKSTSAAPAHTGCPLCVKFLNETTGESVGASLRSGTIHRAQSADRCWPRAD